MKFANPYSRVYEREALALGIKASNSSWAAGDSALLLTSGTTRYAYLPLIAGDVVSAVHAFMTVNPSGVTTAKGGLYSWSGTTGTLLGSSANSTTAFDNYGLSTLTLTTPYTVVTTGHYLVAFLVVATTPPTLLTTASTAGTAGKSSGVIAGASEAAQTDLDASSTLVLSTVALWCGWS